LQNPTSHVTIIVVVKAAPEASADKGAWPAHFAHVGPCPVPLVTCCLVTSLDRRGCGCGWRV
jgi:hypothetical protein